MERALRNELEARCVRPWHRTAAALCALAVPIYGCTASAPATEGESQVLPEAVATSQALSDPNTFNIGAVTANGTGCPAGSWDAQLAPDGQTFTVTFSSYEAEVSPGRLISIKDCQLAVTLHSPQGVTWAVTEFSYSGYAFLESGVTGFQSAAYYFQGNPTDRVEHRSDLSGPLDDSYVYRDTFENLDLVWSPCGRDRDLNITSRLKLQNDPAKQGTGYINTTAADGAVAFVFNLSWKSC